MTNAVSLAQMGSVSPSWRNRIINGDFRIDQRNAGASVTVTASAYTLDRWSTGVTQSSKFTVQQNAGSVTPPVGFAKYLGITSSSAYSVGSGDTFLIQQPVEGNNIADLAWGTANAKTVTLSFLVYSSLTGTFGGSIINGGATRNYLFTYSVTSANTWTTISVTIPGDTAGTWATDNSFGLCVRFGLGSGSTYSGTAGSWGAGNLVQPTSTTSVVGTNGATFYITGVQLEKGSTATSFDYRPYGTELALCQRYYETGTVSVYGYQNSGYLMGGSSSFSVVKRATPTLTVTASRQSAPTFLSVTLAKATLAAAPASNTPIYVDSDFTVSAEL